jgi:XTP/dITP diphosphohydrolase
VAIRLGVGTGNPHKLEEFQRILAPVLPELELVASTGDSPEETGETFIENALIKARAAHHTTGLPSIADDSGIAVDALDGAPGIYSQRYAPSGRDSDNTALLLDTLKGVDNRTAAFVCAAAFVSDRAEVTIERRWEGTIAMEPHGAGGFGYDPIFIPRDGAITAAELSPGEKDALSHRGQAFRELASQIQRLLSE